MRWVREGLVHRQHPELLAGLHRRVDLVHLLADHVRIAGVAIRISMASGAAAVASRDEELVEDRLQHQRQLGPDLGLLVGRKTSMMRSIDSRTSSCVVAARCPVSAIVSAAWMVSRSRISPMSTTSGSCRSTYFRAAGKECVSARPPLVYQRLLVLEEILQRVLDRDDVDVPLPVDPVEHGRHRRRLPVPRRAGHQDEPLVPLDQRAYLGRESQLLEALGLVGNRADGDAHGRPAGGGNADAIAREPDDAVGEVSSWFDSNRSRCSALIRL